MSTEAKSPAGRLPRAWSVLQRSSFALALLLVALAFFRASNAPIWHLDTWGHWKYGEWIWQNGRLPEHEPFSDFSEKDRPLVDTLWLSQVLGYLAYARGGAEGVALFYGLVEAVRVGLYLAAYRRVSGSLPLACAGVVLMEACRWTYFGVFRPQTMGEVFWAATLLACAPALGPGQPVSRWAVLWLPPCFAVWANLHGAFPLGLIVLGVTLAGLLWGRFWSGLRPVVSLADLGTRRLALMLGLSALAACANPYGPKLLIEVARFGQNPVLQLVSEWHPTPPLTTYASKMFIASLVLVLLTARFSPRRFSFGDVTLLLLFGVSAWFAARMLPWWTAVWPLVLLPHWAAIAERLAG
ncbi:MAG TPA: hypothetical protein VFA26_12500, partial [Gemmataceae bacterium]|nr:hypothetical protein [Gemmataceae bacterium]